MNLYKHLLITPVYGIAVLGPQICALILLSTKDFGIFSLIYLAYAWGVSLTMSIVAEPWNRRALRGDSLEWDHYMGACSWVAVTSGLAAFGFALTVSSWSAMALAVSGLSVFAAVVRAGARFFFVQQGLARRVALGDVLFVVGFIAGFSVGVSSTALPIEIAMLAWLIGSVAALLTSLPLSRLPMSFPRWCALHREHIRLLLPDSLMMDSAAIGTPVLISTFLDLASFGTYRAISNVAAPVRLLLDPLRPMIAKDVARVPDAGLKRLCLGLGVALLLASSVAVLLVGVNRSRWDISVLQSLHPYIVPVWVTVFSNFMGHLAYLRVRSRPSIKRLMTGRTVQTFVMVAGPVGGVLAAGLPGAIWGYAAACLLTALVWWCFEAKNV